MKAVVVEHRGDPGTLKEIPTPSPGPQEILVRVTAAGVNPIDWKVRDRGDHALPFVLGQDFAGVVSRTGTGVTKYREGERVFGLTDGGAYAEYTVVPQDDREQPVAKIPDDVGDADAAALPTAGLTALASIEALSIAKETTLLVMGATGGVGAFAVQIAHEQGAHVIAVARSQSEDLARSLGADEFVGYDRQNVVEAVKAAHPAGIDAVLDLVDDAEAIKSMANIVRAGGKIISTVHSADAQWFAQRVISAQNISVFQTLQFSHKGLRTLLELLEQGRIRVTIARERPLSEAVEALEESKSGAVNGKLVITVG